MKTEEIILSCILNDRSIHDMVIPLLKPEYFTGKREGLMKLIRQMHTKMEPIDTYTLVQRIGVSNKVWGVPDLTALAGLVASTANVMAYVQALKYEYIRRTLSNKYGVLIPEDTDPTERLSELIADFGKLQEDGVISKSRSIVDIVEDALRDIESEKTSSGMVGIPTSLGVVNSDTKGLRGGELVIVAGRPGHGKTALALSWAKAACCRHKSVALFTLEMRDREVVKRMIRSFEDQADGAGEISHYALHVFDRGGIDVDFIRSNVRLLKWVDMVVVDYLGLMRMDGRKKRNEAIGDVTRSLKAFALELDIPVILVSQLNRDVEGRASWLHRLSDLRESGDIEQDADKVFFVNTPAKMDLQEIKINNEVIQTDGLTVIQKLKDRNGNAPVFYKAKHKADFSEFYDWAVAPF